MKKLIILIVALSFGTTSYAQYELTKDTKPRKNLIYGTVGFAGLGGIANVNFERRVFSDPMLNIGIKAGYGGWWLWGDAGQVMTLQMVATSSRPQHNFEIGIGALANYDHWSYQYEYHNDFSQDPSRMDYMTFLPSGNIGYRMQKEGSPFVIRAGIGFPDALYASFGLAF